MKIEMHFRHCLLFLYDKDNDISSREAARQLQEVYGEDAPSWSCCARWLAKFRRGDKGIDDLPKALARDY